MSDSRPHVLIALTEAERRDFLPAAPDNWPALQATVSWVTPPTWEPEAWEALLLRERPEVLVAAWAAPRLPATLLRSENQFLKYVCYVAGGVRNLVPREFVEQGLLVSNWGNSISRTIAESALMLSLMALRRAAYWSREMHTPRRVWKTHEETTESLFGRRVGIHGFGAIAQALVPLLKPFGVRIQAYSPYNADEDFTRLGVERAQTLEQLFQENDVFFELAPLTEETRGIVNETLLRSLPEGAVFVNTGRGAVVDEAALARVAAEGRLLVALDVYTHEPLPADSPLRLLENVTLMPHMGGPTTDRRQDAGAHALENLRRYLQGEPLLSVMDLTTYDRST